MFVLLSGVVEILFEGILNCMILVLPLLAGAYIDQQERRKSRRRYSK